MSLSQPLNAVSMSEAVGPRSRPHFLARRRYQVMGAVCFGALLPAAVRHRGMVSPEAFFDVTFAATVAAALLGMYLLKRMCAFPGVSTIAALGPAFVAAYGAAILVIFFGRLDYARFQLLLSFIATVAWFGFVGLVEPRLRRACLLLVPFGAARNLLASNRADWKVAKSHAELPPGISGVVADLRADLSADWQRLLARASLDGLPVYHWKQVAESISGMVDVEHLSENTLGSLLPSSIYVRFKRFLDFGTAIVLLPVALTIIALAALAVRLEDGGPAIFRQQRLGFRGRPFTMFKLRTMRLDASASGPAFTSEDDPRITRVGRSLRKYHVDELPQIFNVLRGEMSWIGPRPEAVSLADWYENAVPFYSYRHIVRPGITGWAQTLQGNVAEVAAATDKLRYDFYYIKYFSPWLDVLIAARTLRAILTGFGSR